MTPQELAQRLNGREYGKEITKEEVALAKASGLVVVLGYSDDGMELAGFIMDEIGAYDGTTVYLTKEGILEKCEDECPHYQRALEKAQPLKAIWSRDGYSWIYEAPFPHATFEVMEEGEKYCRGIVFALADVSAQAPV